jgi:hypothetical protein
MDNGLFFDPQQPYYGGSAVELERKRAAEAQQMGLAQQLGNTALGGGGSQYNLGAGYGQTFADRGASLLSQQQPGGGQAGLSSAQAYQVSSPLAGQAYQSFDPRAAVGAASQVAADQAARNAMSVARGGPNAALGVRQALAMQASGNLQAQQQAQAMALQGELQRGQLGMQASQIGVQAQSISQQLAAQERARLTQLGLSQAQMGLGANAQATSQAAGMAQFRENLYSGRDMNTNNSQLQADQYAQQMAAIAAQQKQAFVGGMVNAAGGVVGGAAGMV